MQNQKGCVASQSFALQGRKALGKEQFASANWLLCKSLFLERTLQKLRFYDASKNIWLFKEAWEKTIC
jgi:hypothetical protein